MPVCEGKLSTGYSCPKPVKRGHKYCHWHDPEDESWRKVYERLRKAAPEEKVEILFELIEDHPEHKLVLPERSGWKASLSQIDLSRETLLRRKNQSEADNRPWFLSGVARLRNANLQGADMQYTNLQGVDMKYANLQGAFLIHTNLQDAILENANLQDAHLWAANLKDSHLGLANLQGANLQNADLQGANLLGTDLRDAKLWSVNLQSANLSYANLQGAMLQEAKLQGVNLSVTENIANIYISGAWLDRTRMWREQLGNAIGEDLEHYYAAAKVGYLALKQNFDNLGDYEAASWAYCKERRMEKLEAKEKGREALKKLKIDDEGYEIPKKRNWQEAATSYLKFFSDTFVEWLCDYGESVSRVIGWMAVLLFVVGPLLFSGLGGFVWSDGLVHDYFTLSSSWQRFWLWYYHYLLYTLDALTTASFSGLQPINDTVKLASGLFAITGIVLAGLLGFVAGNRIRRS